MKTLLTIRHAKSNWKNDFNDFDRPLNDRGKREAPEMAQRIISRKINIDVFISSSAARARRTAELFAEAYAVIPGDIQLVTALYHAPAEVFYETVQSIDDRFATAAVFSHNPGITTFVNSLIERVHIDNMPPCGVFAVQAPVERWHDFEKAEKEMLFFDYPALP